MIELTPVQTDITNGMESEDKRLAEEALAKYARLVNHEIFIPLVCVTANHHTLSIRGMLIDKTDSHSVWFEFPTWAEAHSKIAALTESHMINHANRIKSRRYELQKELAALDAEDLSLG